MEGFRSWIYMAVALLATADAQLQLIGNSVVDSNFFVVGELRPGETLDQFERRFQQTEGRSLLRQIDPEAPRVPTAASSSEPLGLPSGATEVLGRIDQGFSCEGLPFGYYSDSSNDCRVYHVCNPGQDGSQTNQYSFFCNAGTEFDQQLLTCVHESPDRSACSNARQFYESSNSQFFRNVKFNEGVSLPSPAVPSSTTNEGDVVLIGVTGGVPLGDISQTGGGRRDQNVVGELEEAVVDNLGSVDGAGLLDFRFGLPLV